MLIEDPKCSLDAKNEHGMTALHWAAVRGRRKVAMMLLAAGASTDVVDENGDKPGDIAQGDACTIFKPK